MINFEVGIKLIKNKLSNLMNNYGIKVAEWVDLLE